jgi:hypothetical protein
MNSILQKKKKTLFFDKLISSYTLTRKKAQKNATLELNFTEKHYSSLHPNLMRTLIFTM